MLKIIKLTQTHRHARVDWYAYHVYWSRKWSRVVSLCQRKINLNGPMISNAFGTICVPSDDLFYSFNSGGRNVMVWGGILDKEEQVWRFLNITLNSTGYADVFKKCHLSFVYSNHGYHIWFMQNIAYIYKSRHMRY